MANTFGKQNKVVFDTTQIKKLEVQMKRMANEVESSKKAEKLLDKALRDSVKPWQEAVNNGWVYKWVNKDKGRLQDPFGNTKIKGRRKGVYGRRVGPKLKGKTGGWFAHFFASPAKQIRRKSGTKYKIPFAARFRGKNGKVAAAAKTNIAAVVDKLARGIFK